VSEPFWRGDACSVTVGYAASGALEFHGYDRRAFGTAGSEYEYVVTVGAADLPALRRALGVQSDDDVLAAVVAHVDDIMPTGESTWLTRHGIEHRVSVWSDQ
jgi:hypothetical protein